MAVAEDGDGYGVPNTPGSLRSRFWHGVRTIHLARNGDRFKWILRNPKPTTRWRRPCEDKGLSMRQDTDFFGDIDLELLFIAGRLKEAKALEAVLTEAGVDYLIETDTYRGGFIFVSERVGAFFYCREEHAGNAREVMRAAGYKPYVTKE